MYTSQRSTSASIQKALKNDCQLPIYISLQASTTVIKDPPPVVYLVRPQETESRLLHDVLSVGGDIRQAGTVESRQR
ncbi:hypothetical protein Agabi119p4_7918 [Agaricus bisporus var. burnettii]|uniref:Uncharacterized protein n=1 Tax=Agaricus bisporus var. burnettii TaxID=192524 RepID=A0A8H7C960_AGABI|nr:hypothetical protein Agabi119p4_7918 [Agaricus bisporus var. burnettii]